ncbi:HupE/UreJ family protein [Gaopeijia maritima]|uniref:HupE/UreJ family protein n=1 Tax=Gaopeijia maritima TaxID=3119007 RepID=UPI00324FAB72
MRFAFPPFRPAAATAGLVALAFMATAPRPVAGAVGATLGATGAPSGAIVAPSGAPGTASGASSSSGASASGAAVVRHEVPANVSVQAYVRPSGSTLTVLVRVPLESMRDVLWPRLDDGSLDLAHPELPALLREAAQVWIAGYLAFEENGRPLPEERIVATRLTAPGDRTFNSWAGAEALLNGPGLPTSVRMRPEVALFDVRLEVPITDDEARFTVDPELAHLGIETVSVIHLVLPDGAERVFQYVGNPGPVQLDPRWHQAVLRFVMLGFDHILEGWDHLLFVLCLVIPFRSVRGLVPVVTAFTVAHSITLIAAAMGMAPDVLWFPPLVETLIAASIVWMALENVLGIGRERRWTVAFGAGLIHGFGFSFLLSESLQFAGGHLVSSLLAFNVGVELGQLVALAVFVPVLRWVFARLPEVRPGEIVVSVLVGHTAWHWMTERGAGFAQYDITLPLVDAGFVADAMRWGALALVALGASWLLSNLFGRARGSGTRVAADS